MTLARITACITVVPLALAVLAIACGNPDDGVRALADTSPAAAETAAEERTQTAATREANAGETGAPSTGATAPPDTVTPEAFETPAPTAPPDDGPTATSTVPPARRQIAFSPGEELTQADLYARGAGVPIHAPFVGERLVIRELGIDLPFVVRVVGPNGVMPDPAVTDAVAWFDFSAFAGLGGSPGTDHGNVIIGGEFVVLNSIELLAPGDIIQINTTDGRTLAYQVEFNKISTLETFDEVVAATDEESITLFTGTVGPDRQRRRIVWGRAIIAGSPIVTPSGVAPPVAGDIR